MKQRWLAILLSLCLVLGLTPGTAWAVGTYVALGDSITTGYGLEDGDKSFAQQLAEAQGLALENLAEKGATSADVLEELKEPGAQEFVENAQLITLTVGGNDLMAALYQYLARAYNEKNPGANLDWEAVPEQILNGNLASFAAENLAKFINSDEHADARATFENNFLAIVENIRGLNPTARLIVANQYNPYGHVVDGMEESLQKVAQKLIITPVGNAVTGLNETIADAAETKGYEVADIYSAFADAKENPCNASLTVTGSILDLTYDFDPDFHPNAAGHTLIAQTLGRLLGGGTETVQVAFTVAPAGAGVVTDAEWNPLASPLSVEKGQVVVLQALANPGYRFVRWSKDGTTVATDATLTTNSLTSDQSLTAEFEALSYSLAASPGSLDFGRAREGYGPVAAQGLTLVNNSDAPLYLSVEEPVYFTVTAEGQPPVWMEMAAEGGQLSLEVRPRAGLAAGTYEETLTVSGYSVPEMQSEALAVAQVSLSFVVEDEDGGQGGDQDGNQGGGSSYGDTIPYRVLRFETNGGTEVEDVRKLEGTEIDLSGYVTEREGFVFAGWYSDEALTRPVEAVKLTADKTVYAAWTEEETGWAENPFWDVADSDWFCPAVQYVYENGLMVGTGSTTFGPNEKITRGQVVAILYRMEGSPVVAQTGEKFTDVDSSAYYADAIAWASNIGIMSGYGQGIYGPNVPMPLEQVVAVLYRYAQYKGWDVSVGADTNILSYADAQEISEYAIPAFQWACGAGVIAGDGERLNPGVVATRAQLAQILRQFGEVGTQTEA